MKSCLWIGRPNIQFCEKGRVLQNKPHELRSFWIFSFLWARKKRIYRLRLDNKETSHMKVGFGRSPAT